MQRRRGPLGRAQDQGGKVVLGDPGVLEPANRAGGYAVQDGNDDGIAAAEMMAQRREAAPCRCRLRPDPGALPGPERGNTQQMLHSIARQARDRGERVNMADALRLWA